MSRAARASGRPPRRGKIERDVRDFDSPDELIELETVRSAMVSRGSLTVSHDVYQPGWRWSLHVKPIVGTEWCELHHVGVNLRGRVEVRLRDGTAFDIGPMAVFDVPPGHDAWVVGDEPAEMITWTGARGFLAPLESFHERVLVTMLFSDIVDSTGIAGRLGQRAWGDLLAAHESRTRETAARFRGRVVKFTGDGALLTFDGAARAARCAVTLRDAMADLGIELRLALHTGEVEEAGEDIRGLAIHEAARILDIAEPGEILVSAATMSVAGELGVEDRGDHVLRGLPGARRLYAIV